MEQIHPRCAGIDIGKKRATVCIRVPGPNPSSRRAAERVSEQVTTWSSMTGSVLQLREQLIQAQVTCVVMEATSDYWKPFYFLLEDAGFELMLVNARHVKNVPGRKSDVNDATWLAQLAAHGLVRPSLVPPAPIRELRDLTRTRTHVVRERNREFQRMEKMLESAGIKLSSVASDLSGVSCRKMLEALADGERDPKVLAGLAHPTMAAKRPMLEVALTGRFNDHHGFLARTHLALIRAHDQAIADLDERIEVVMEPFRGFRDLICSIPGISTTVADVVIAETGADLTVFPSPQHLASWAGVCPGNNESAGVVKSTHTRPGNAYLKAALGIAAMSASRTKHTALAARCRRIKKRRGYKRAIVALMRHMLAIIWRMAATGAYYQDPGPDYHTARNPQRALNHAIRTIQAQGFQVQLTPAAA